jgi:hypothetical protein
MPNKLILWYNITSVYVSTVSTELGFSDQVKSNLEYYTIDVTEMVLRILIANHPNDEYYDVFRKFADIHMQGAFNLRYKMLED